MKKFAVIGLGHFGMALAKALSENGAEVIAIDKNMEAVEEVKDLVSVAVRLDSIDDAALRSQNLAEVDAAIVAIGENFEANLLTTVLLKRIGVKKVISRSGSQIEHQILDMVGTDMVISPEIDSGKRLAETLINPTIFDYVSLAENYIFAQVEAPKPFQGKKISELDIRKRYGVNVVAIKHSEHMIPLIDPNYKIEAEDVLMVVGEKQKIEELSQL
jgi:trk system potassium uptake protein TrkA